MPARPKTSNASSALNLLAQAVRAADPSARESAICRFNSALVAVLERRLSHAIRMGDQRDLPDDRDSYQDLWSGAANWGAHVALESLLRGEPVDNIMALAYTAAWRSAVDELRKLALRRAVRARPDEEVLDAMAARVASESPLDRLEMRTLAQHVVRCLLDELRLAETAGRNAYATMMLHVLIDESHPPIHAIARGLSAAVKAAHPDGLNTATKEMLALALSILHMPTPLIAQSLDLQPGSIACYVKRARGRLRRVTGMPTVTPRAASARGGPARRAGGRHNRMADRLAQRRPLPTGSV